MSLVGTRPPTVDEYEQYELGHRKRLAIFKMRRIGLHLGLVFRCAGMQTIMHLQIRMMSGNRIN